MTGRIALTPEQIVEVTGRKRAKEQCLALANMRIPFRVRHNGTPFVAVSDISLNQQTTISIESPTLITL